MLPNAETLLPKAETLLLKAETLLLKAETLLPKAETLLPKAATLLPKAAFSDAFAPDLKVWHVRSLGFATHSAHTNLRRIGEEPLAFEF